MKQRAGFDHPQLGWVRMSRASANVFAGINASASIGRRIMAKTNDTNSRIWWLQASE